MVICLFVLLVLLVLSADVPALPSSSGGIMLLPPSPMIMQQQPQQPYVLLPQVSVASPINNMIQTGTNLMPGIVSPKAGNGYFWVSPSPMLQMVSSAGAFVTPTQGLTLGSPTGKGHQ